MPKDEDSESLDNAAEKERFLGGAGKYENLRITKNVVFLGMAFMLHFTAFHGTVNLQSSIHASESMGTYTLAAIYGSLIVSNIFLPVAVIRLVIAFQYHVLHLNYSIFNAKICLI